jgi:polyisoprenoid-binding protein YceI
MRWCLLCVLLFLAVPVWASPTVYSVRPGSPQSVRFDAQTQTERYGGHTDQVSGLVQVDPALPTRAPVAHIEVRLASLSTGNSTRDSNMRRSFLETDRYPTASFVMTGLTAPPGSLVAGRSVSGRATGTFTLHGVTRTVSPVVTVTRGLDRQGRESLHIIAAFTVRLTDYGIGTPRFLFFAVRQEHSIVVDVLAVAGNAP